MTIEMSIGMTVRRKIIGISKPRDMREGLETIMKMHMKTGTARIITELATKTKVGINIDRCRDDSYNLGGGRSGRDTLCI